MEAILQYIERKREDFLEGLKELLRFPSISTDPKYEKDCLACADWEVQKLKSFGFENVETKKAGRLPVIYGDWLHAPGKPTLLIYGHYDVQPPDPLNLWVTPPFEPSVRNGNLHARGAVDNKGQHYSHFCALEAYLKTTKSLPVNVKIMLEGTEESGSEGTIEFVKENPDLLACDTVLISDTGWLDKDHPAIVYSLRGLCYFELIVRGPKKDLHSGAFGGYVQNPLNALSLILAKLKDEKGKILIPGFYDDVLSITAKEKEEMKKLPWHGKYWLEELGVPSLEGEEGFTTLERNWFRPTLDVNGLWGGYQGAGAKTVIAAEAGAKVSMRLVAKQDPEEICRLFEEYVRKVCPRGVTVKAKRLSASPPVYMSKDNPFMEKAAWGYSQGFGKKVIFTREGASIPVVTGFQEVLKVPVILAGLGLPDDCVHSPNEKFSLKNFFDGICGAVYTYQAFSKITL